MIKWLALGHTVTKWQRQDLTQIAWLQRSHSLQGCWGWWDAETEVASCVQVLSFQLLQHLRSPIWAFPTVPSPAWTHNRSLIMSVTWKLNQPFDAQVRCFLQTLIICNYVNTLSHHSLVTKIAIIIGYPSWTRCFMNFISNATVFNSMGNCWMFIVCQALGYCPQFTSEQNKAPTLSDLLEWWIWTEDRGLFDAKAHILCSAHPTFPVGAHLLTVQLY